MSDGVVTGLALAVTAAAVAFIAGQSWQPKPAGVQSDAVEKTGVSNVVPAPTVSSIGSPHPFIDVEGDYEGCIYLDYNATTPVYAEVFEAMRPYLTTSFGNPASSHIYGRRCAGAVLNARRQVGSLIHAHDAEKEVMFMSCGTEADNSAVEIALHHYHQHRRQSLSDPTAMVPLPLVLASKVEHPAVLCYLRVLELRGRLRLRELPVNADGLVDVVALSQELSVDTALVTIMHSNNEVGTIQPIKQIAQIVTKFNIKHGATVLLHTDAAQSIGKVPVDVQALQCDLLTLVGHKFGAPKGVGALFVRSGVKAPMLMIGGGQERGLRAGTESVAHIVALGKACELAERELGELLLHYMALRQAFLAALHTALQSEWDQVKFNGPARGHDEHALVQDTKMLRVVLRPFLDAATSRRRLPDQLVKALPNTISVSFRGKIGHELVAQLANKVACSAGSACHSAPVGDGTHAPTYALSDVLKAMGANEEFGLGTLRLSFGRHSSTPEVEAAARLVAEAVRAAPL